jgi:hypothetical protein
MLGLLIVACVSLVNAAGPPVITARKSMAMILNGN